MWILTQALALAILASCAVSAQVSGVFSMDREIVPSGQTAFLNFKVTNSGPNSYMLNTTGIPVQPSCAGYSIKILHQPTQSKSGQNAILANTCVLNGQFEYLPIAPGATYVQKIDLRVYLDLQVRGEYVFEAMYSPLWRKESPPAIAPTKTTLSFRIE
jgi:azurin